MLIGISFLVHLSTAHQRRDQDMQFHPIRDSIKFTDISDEEIEREELLAVNGLRDEP